MQVAALLFVKFRETIQISEICSRAYSMIRLEYDEKEEQTIVRNILPSTELSSCLRVRKWNFCEVISVAVCFGALAAKAIPLYQWQSRDSTSLEE